MDVEGIFRRSASSQVVREVKQRYESGSRLTNLVYIHSCADAACDAGEDVDLRSYGDIHLAAVLIKSFLRELQEPLLTFGAYEQILSIEGM
jgi:hypothetical protein